VEMSVERPPLLLLGADLNGQRGLCFWWDGGSWQFMEGVRLPRATLIVAERVAEVTAGGSFRDAVHAIDAVLIAGDDIRRQTYSERRRRLGLLVSALERDDEVLRQSVHGSWRMGHGGDVGDEEERAVRCEVPLRLKPAYNLGQLGELITAADARRSQPGLRWPFKGLFLFPGHNCSVQTLEPANDWAKRTSSKSGHEYWFNSRTGKSVWSHELVKKPISFRSCASNMLRWQRSEPAVNEAELIAFSDAARARLSR